jgi:hypothetical protein
MLGIVNRLDDLFKLGHPRNSQMAIHEEYPSTAHQVVINHDMGFGALATTQRNLIALLGHVHFFSETQEIGNWIGTSRQHEDKRLGDGTVLVGFGQIEHGRLNKLFAQLVNNEVLHRQCDTICTQSLQNNHFLELIELGIPFSRQFFNFRSQRIENSFEFTVVLQKELF